MDAFRPDATNDLLKPTTDNILIGTDMMSHCVDEEGNMMGTKRNWAEMRSKAGEEINHGVMILVDMLITVGWKA